jgi:sec-independent protein translocase protein TatB
VFDLSPEKILLLGIIALVVLGPNRLPQAARSLGHVVGQLRRMSASFQTEVRDALADPAEALNATVGDLRPSQIRRSVRDAVTSTFTVPPQSSTLQPVADPSMAAPDDPSLN